MHAPKMLETRHLDHETSILPSVLPVPGAGLLPVNAALIRAAQPILIDSGLAALGPEFRSALDQAIDPHDLRWIWITHTDPDHVGNLRELLERSPHARVVTNFLGMGKLGLLGLPTDRVRLLNPGQRLDLGDRELTALTPPIYDAPETMAAFDPGTRTLYSADSFGALLDRPYEDAGEIGAEALRTGLLAWSHVDAPWLRDIDRSAFIRSLDRFRQLGVARIVSAHLPPASELTDTILDGLAEAPGGDPFVGPDQAAFDAMLNALAS